MLHSMYKSDKDARGYLVQEKAQHKAYNWWACQEYTIISHVCICVWWMKEQTKLNTYAYLQHLYKKRSKDRQCMLQLHHKPKLWSKAYIVQYGVWVQCILLVLCISCGYELDHCGVVRVFVYVYECTNIDLNV